MRKDPIEKILLYFDTLEYALPLEAYYFHTPLLESWL